MLQVDSDTMMRLRQAGLAVKTVNEIAVMIENVTTASECNKQATNILIQYVESHRRYMVLVDADLEYNGTDKRLSSALRLRQTSEGWRPLLLEPLPSELPEAIGRALELVGGEEHSAFLTGDSFLSRYATDLTQRAANDLLTPCIGRTKEIAMLHTLVRKWSSPRIPLIIGASGTGKTNLIHGFASACASKNKTWRLWLVDVAALISGCIFAGDRVNAVQRLLDEVRADTENILLLENAHLIAELCPLAEELLIQDVDAGLKLILTTHHGGDGSMIFLSAPMRRRCCRILISETERAETEQILRGLRNILEKHHDVKIPDVIIQFCVTQSESLSGKNPSKALSILDTACAGLTSGETVTLDDTVQALELCS